MKGNIAASFCVMVSGFSPLSTYCFWGLKKKKNRKTFSDDKSPRVFDQGLYEASLRR